ncbi:FAD-dependent oxidoreductase [Micromonospora sp. BRA006-A]|nr:FAD-dependent oxidoreductase [Micromonospora sp. BRA006-A]
MVGVYEANDPVRYARHVGAVLGAASKLTEAGRYGWRMLRRRVPYRRRTAVVAAHGDDQLAGVTVAAISPQGSVVPGSERHVGCDGLAVGFGFTPQVEVAVALGCETFMDRDGGLVVRIGPDQATSVPGVYAAGEVTGVGGAKLALVEGTSPGTRSPGLSVVRGHCVRVSAVGCCGSGVGCVVSPPLCMRFIPCRPSGPTCVTTRHSSAGARRCRQALFGRRCVNCPRAMPGARSC